MRLFFDANILTYIAIFENYLCEGTAAELDAAIHTWAHLQGSQPDSSLLQEVQALRVLYLVDDYAHFDWLFSDIGLAEVLRIRNKASIPL